MKSAVANSITASLSSISVASCSPVSSPDSGTTQAPALTMPNTTSSISTELPISTATWWPGPTPRAPSALATRLMLALKSPQVRRTGPQTTASLSGWLRPCTSNTSGISTLVSSSRGAGFGSVIAAVQRTLPARWRFGHPEKSGSDRGPCRPPLSRKGQRPGAVCSSLPAMTTLAPPIYDPADPAVRRDPFPLYARLQDDDPVHWSPALRAWVLTRYEDVRQMMLSESMSPDRLRPFYAQLTASGATRWPR